MSIDDDGWDVEGALRGKPEAESFKRFMKWAYTNEMEFDKMKKEFYLLKSAFKIVAPDGYKTVKVNDES